MSFTIVQPLQHTINTVGNDVYTGTVVRGTNRYAVAIETPPTAQDTTERAQTYIAAFKADGYVTNSDTADYWYGMKGTAEAEVITNTMDGFIIAFETA